MPWLAIFIFMARSSIINSTIPVTIVAQITREFCKSQSKFDIFWTYFPMKIHVQVGAFLNESWFATIQTSKNVISCHVPFAIWKMLFFPPSILNSIILSFFSDSRMNQFAVTLIMRFLRLSKARVINRVYRTRKRTKQFCILSNWWIARHLSILLLSKYIVTTE